MRRDGRNPYGSRGGYVDTRGGMDYARNDYNYSNREYDSRRGDRAYSQSDYERNGRDYEQYRQSDMARGDYRDMREDYARGGNGDYNMDYARGRGRDYADYENQDMARGRGGRDGHYGRGYMPIEAMGYFNGYYGMPEDYARGGRRDYRSDYGYDYGYDFAGDYGQNLTKEELEHWCKKMMSKLDEREKQMFSKEAILQRAKNMGIQFDKFSEMEFYVNVVKNYTDHKKSIGESPDMAIKLARDDFNDEDGEYKGSEWLAIYFDIFVKQD